MSESITKSGSVFVIQIGISSRVSKNIWHPEVKMGVDSIVKGWWLSMAKIPPDINMVFLRVAAVVSGAVMTSDR